ncbi:hypothetical protein [Alteromonas sp. a30]|uniref:hypothetical protein n=1 Tax=Alteromonas sp. a30 TaxID=2730917 RepID=UPI00227F1C77|nr:hypothetical protein [Alteromonas sp. a30]MCY7296509.1 hypothetical protein [Alteromonas sp. a30]
MTTYKMVLTFAVLSSILLASCLKVGSNVGSNILTLNASILKGQFRQAQVQVVDAQGQRIWEGFADDTGSVDIDIRGIAAGEIRIQAQPASGSSMLCDAIQCMLPTGGSVAFGEQVNVGAAETFVLNTSLHTQALNADVSTVQVSGLSQMAYQWLTSSGSSEYRQSGEQHQKYARLTSKLITTSLGLDIPSELNMLQSRFVDLNQTLAFGPESISNSVLSLVNASLASDFRIVESYSQELANLAKEPSNPSVQGEFEAIQKRILKETQKLASLPGLTGLDASVINQINQAANNELDFSRINAAMQNAKNGIEPEPEPNGPYVESIRSSTSHWRPSATNLRENAWWWVSRANSINNEWIQFTYDQPVALSAMLFAIDKDRGGNNLALQGRNSNDAVWTNIELNLSDIVVSQSMTDEKNVVHVRYSFSQEQQALGRFERFRLLSSPTNALWLEYLCFGTFSAEDDCFSGVANPPSSVTVSSLWFDASNVANANTSWISRMISEQSEWLQITYSEPVRASAINVVAKAEFLGEKPEIQARNDNEQWQTLLQLNVGQLQESADEDGVVRAQIPLPTTQAFSEYRYYSQPTTFVWIQQFELTI